MNIIDILIVIVLIWAVISGFRQGIARQASGIAGLILGVWLGFRFGATVGLWLSMKGETAKVVGFIIIVIVSLCVCSLVGWLIGKLLKMASLGMIDTIGGVLLSTFKALVILSVLLVCFDVANNQWRMVRKSYVAESRLYAPVMEFSSKIFPVINNTRDKLFRE